LRVLLHEVVEKMLRLLLLLFHTSYLCDDFVGCHYAILQFSAWGYFLLHHAAFVVVVGVTWVDNLGGRRLVARGGRAPKGGTSSFTKIKPWSGGGMDKGK
jgi:hypothetical protein